MSEGNLKLVVDKSAQSLNIEQSTSVNNSFEQNESLCSLLDLIEEMESIGQHFMIY